MKTLTERAAEIGWKESACELFDHGYRLGYESPDGRSFLTNQQMAYMLETVCQLNKVPPCGQAEEKYPPEYYEPNDLVDKGIWPA